MRKSIFLITSLMMGSFQTLEAAEVSKLEVQEKLKSFNVLRETLASSLDHKKTAITEEDFKKTCMVVGKEIKTWSTQKGLKVQQISNKNRNSMNQLVSRDETVYAEFTKNKDLQFEMVSEETLYYRIPVVSSCLHCHGAKNSRPDFIKTKYPEDKAYDFKIGDLRGLYKISFSKGK